MAKQRKTSSAKQDKAQAKLGLQDPWKFSWWGFTIFPLTIVSLIILPIGISFLVYYETLGIILTVLAIIGIITAIIIAHGWTKDCPKCRQIYVRKYLRPLYEESNVGPGKNFSGVYQCKKCGYEWSDKKNRK